MPKSSEVSLELIQDLTTIATLMAKHKIVFSVNVIGDTQGLSYESRVEDEGGWDRVVIHCSDENSISSASILNGIKQLPSSTTKA